MRKRVIAAALTAVFLFTAFGVTAAYAKGGGPYEPECPYLNNILEPEAPAYDPALAYEEYPPAEESEQRPFTPPGTGTVVDNVTNEDGKEFFTITSAAGNIFFLIIDRQRETENVYFLNAVTERDLLALAEESGDTWETSTPPPIIPNVPDPTPEVEPKPEPEPEPEPERGGNGGTIILLIIIVLGGGGAGYYFKIYRPKQEGADTAEDDYDYSGEDDYYNEPVDDAASWDAEDEDNRDDEE